jgi:hypothetical protein
MYNCPYCYNNFYRMPNNSNNYSYIRVLHASPDAPSVDVYANGTMIANNLGYRGFTQYIKVPAGFYNIRIFPAGTTETPVLETDVEIQTQSIYTVAAIGLLENLALLPVLEPLRDIDPGYAMIRFAHLSPGTPAVDITLPDGQKLFKSVEYTEVTGYIPVKQGTYTLQARLAGTDTIALTVPNVRLQHNNLYTVYAVGLADASPPLQVLIPLDGSTYLTF